MTGKGQRDFEASPPWSGRSLAAHKHKPCCGVPRRSLEDQGALDATLPYQVRPTFERQTGDSFMTYGTSDTLIQVGVVGCGLMGAGIAEVCARAERSVVVVEAKEDRARAGAARITAWVERAHARGKVADVDLVMNRSRFETALAAMADRDLVVDAIVEEESAKVSPFRSLETIVNREDAILATNTSSIPVMKLAVATRRPAQVLGIHLVQPRAGPGAGGAGAQSLTDPGTTNRPRAFVMETLGNTHRVTEPRRFREHCSFRSSSPLCGCSSQASPPRTTSIKRWCGAQGRSPPARPSCPD
jgi:hypothetical protein